MPLDAAIGRVLFTPYRPSGCHGHQFWSKNLSCGVEKPLFEASAQKARNGPSTQLIEATSCVERWSAMIKAKEHIPILRECLKASLWEIPFIAILFLLFRQEEG